MNGLRAIALALIVGGVLALAYGGFSYTDEKTAAKIGPLEINVKEQKSVSIPIWLGIAGIVGGVLVLVGAGRR
jgi:TRAP-type C4-dicarboxylate transport system permease small subunit